MTKSEIDYKYNLNVYFSFLKGSWLFITILFILIFLLEGTYVIENLILKIIIDSITDYAAGSMLQEALYVVLFSAVAGYISLVIFRITFAFFRMSILNRIDAKAISQMKKTFFTHIVRLSHDFHVTHKTGGLISKLTRCGNSIENFTDTIIFNFAPFLLKSLWIVVIVGYFNIIAAFIIITTMIIFIIFTYFRQKKAEKYNILMNDAEDSEKSIVSDILTNIDSVMLFGKEKHILRKHLQKVQNTKNMQLSYWDSWRMTELGQSLILSIGFILVIILSVFNFIHGQITLGTTVFIFNSFWSLVGNVYGFAGGLRQFSRCMSDFEELFKYKKETPSIVNHTNSIKKKIKKGHIQFEDVSFSYTKKRAIRNVQLNIKPGEKIALVGHSGSGKSTLVKLLYRLYDVQKGKILIDSTPIEKYDIEFLRSEMSVVPQEAILFDESIFENIKFSKPKAKKNEVFAAIKKSQLDTIIKNFPQNEHTIVGERGVKLSGGEKQRVSIARAILANKKILVLDEATSALDSETEFSIQKALQKLLKGKTAIIIAHRLSTIMNVDRIIVLDKGKIVEIGSHSQLLRKKGKYYHLWQLQKGGFIE